MTIPYQIYFLNMHPQESVALKIRDEVLKLKRYSNEICSSRIIIDTRYDEDISTNLYSVKINITLLNNIIVTNRYQNLVCEYEDILVAIWRAFNIIRQQLNNFFSKKHHTKLINNNLRPNGCSIKLFKTNCTFTINGEPS